MSKAKQQEAIWSFAQEHGCLAGDCRGCPGESEAGCIHPEHQTNIQKGEKGLQGDIYA